MKTFNKEGLRFIIGTLVASVTAVLVASIISTSLGTLAEAIRESNVSSVPTSSSSSSSIASSSLPSSVSSSASSSSSEPVIVVHQVTFNAAGGSAVNPATLQINDGEYILNFPSTTLANHTFLGWFTGVTPNDVLFTGTMPVVQDMTLFARWKLIEETEPEVEPGALTWRIAFDAAGGSPVDTIQVQDGKTMALPTTTREGYVFLGWYTGNLPGDVLFTSATIVGRDMTLLARWDRESFMITFISNGGSFVAPITAKADTEVTAPVNPIRVNYMFDGWYVDQILTESFVFDVMPEISVTLYAKWIEGTYEGLTYICGGNECIITGYEGIHSSIYIPSEIDGLPVTMIADRAFQGNETLVSVTIQDEEGAASSLRTIGTSAFADMPILRSVSLPTSLRTIKSDAFRNSSLLQALDVPLTVNNLGTNVLTGAESIERVTVRPANNIVNTPVINFKYLFGGTAYNSAVSVPSSLETIILPEGTTTLPNDFLRDLPMVRHVVAPSTIDTYGTNVLTGANNLNSLTWTFISNLDNNPGAYLSYLFGAAAGQITNVPSTLTTVTINSKAGINRIGNSAFYNISTLTEVNLPESIKIIGTTAFAHAAAGTSRLQYIELPSELTSIENSAFLNSSALLEFTIPDTVTSIGTSVLQGTTALQTLRTPIISAFYRYLFGGSTATSGGILPTNLRTIEFTSGATMVASFLQGFTSVETIYLPNTLTTIGNNAFNGMTGLKQMQLLGSLPVADRVILPNSVNTFGTNVFQGATNIKHVTLPNLLTTIPADTFNGATNLETVVVNPLTTVIGNNAFLNTKLSTFVFPTALTTIGSAAFQGTLLTNVTVPNTVTAIGNDAFRNMNGLTTIVFPSSVPVAPATLFSLGTNVLTGAQVLNRIDFHIDMLPATSANRLLRYFFGGSTSVIGTIPSTLTTVNLLGGTVLSGQFFGTVSTSSLTNLINISLPNSLIEIQTLAFDGATGIVNLTIPETVNNIGNSAFRGMTGLLQLTFLRQTLPSTVGTTLFATSSVNATALPNLFIVVQSEDAKTAYAVNAQFAAFANATPTRLVVAQPAV